MKTQIVEIMLLKSNEVWKTIEHYELELEHKQQIKVYTIQVYLTWMQKYEYYLLWTFACIKVWPALPISGPLSPWLLMMYHVWCRRRKHSRPRLRSQNLSKCPNGGNFKCSISAHVRIPDCLFLKSISFCSFLSVCLPFQVWGVLNLYLDWT